MSTAGSLLALDTQLQSERVPERSLAYSIDLHVELWEPDLSEPFEDVTEFVDASASSISYSAAATPRHTARLRWSGQVDWNAYRVKLLVTLTDDETRESYTESMGFYTCDRWVEVKGTTPSVYETHLTDVTGMFDQPIGYTYVVDKGSNIVTAMQAARDAAFTWHPSVAVTADAPLGPQLQLPLAQTALHTTNTDIFPHDKTWWFVISFLADTAGYQPPYMTRDGVVVVEESARTASSIGLPSGAFASITEGARLTTDLQLHPNQWVIYGDIGDPDVDAPGAATTAIISQTDIAATEGAHSFASRGRRYLRRVYSIPAASLSSSSYDRATAFELEANDLIRRDRESVNTITFMLAPIASLWHNEVAELPDIGATGLWRITDWELPLNGDPMRCKAVKI